MTAPIAAVVLAAGFGTRLAPLTDRVPKPLLEVGGAPVASHLIDGLRTIPELADIVVVVNDLHPGQFERWRERLADPHRIHLVNTGARSNDERHGAVVDLRTAIGSLPEHQGRWLVVAGDNLVDPADLRALADVGAGGLDAVLCRDVGLAPQGRFGEVTIDGKGRVHTFREKPPDRRSPIAATATYALRADALDQLDAYLSSGGDPDASGRFIGWLSTQRPVHAQLIAGAYHDIGTPENLAAARSSFDVP